MEDQIKIQASYFSVEMFTEILILTGSVLVMIGAPLSIITGVKVHYLVFFICTVLIYFINLSPYINLTKFAYFLFLFLSVGWFIATKPIDLPFIYSILTYIIIPFAFFNRVFKNYNHHALMKAFEVFTFINFLGVLLQVYGVESVFLDVDLVMTEGEYYPRYGSLAGGTLALGFTASISCIYAFYKTVYDKQKTLYNYLVIFYSLVTLLLAQSRRFYVLVFLVMLVIFLFDVNKKYNVKKALIIAFCSFLLLSVIIYIAYQFKSQVYFLERGFSILNFEDDAANLQRVAKWLLAINTFLKNIYFGIGIGGTGTIGKNFTEESSLEDLLVAESYYIKVFVEAGVFFGLFFLWLAFKYLFKSFKLLRNKKTAMSAALFIFFFFECFMSTSLESPLPSMIFWISLSQLMFNEPKLSSEV